MILDEEGDGDWVCIEPVVRVAGVELQFTFVIELALSKGVVFYFYMSQEEEGSPVLKGVGADARMSRYLDPRNLSRTALAPVLLRNVSPRHGSRGPVGSGQHGCGGTETLQGCRCIPNVGAEGALGVLLNQNDYPSHCLTNCSKRSLQNTNKFLHSSTSTTDISTELKEVYAWDTCVSKKGDSNLNGTKKYNDLEKFKK